MKYYTPDLLVRFGSADEQAALAAQEELEERAEKYTKHLKAIQAKLPARFREMEQRFYLHDARLISPGFPFPAHGPWRLHWLDWFEMYRLEGTPGRLPSLIFALQLDTPPREVLVLHYRSVVLEELSQHRPFQEEPLPFLEWLHDEIDVVTEKGVHYPLHSILFSNGLELRLQFDDFDYATLKPLMISSETNGSAGG
jgi:hypothetical protein